jgi:hypothetical protein
MKRKRAAGGGRKPKGEFSQLTSSLTIRIPEDMRKQLESEAAARGQSVAQVLLWHLRQSFNLRHDRERDPALQGLLFMIGQLAERIGGGRYSGGRYILDADYRPHLSENKREWRTDLFKFRAFKFAVGQLLDTLKEPPGKIRPMTKQQAKEADIFNGGPEFIKEMVELFKSPESLGAFEFKRMWMKVTRDDPLSEEILEVMRKDPIYARVAEREYYGFQRARKALELKPTTTKPEGKGND